VRAHFPNQSGSKIFIPGEHLSHVTSVLLFQEQSFKILAFD
jgi:hypothetical protein